MTATTITGHTNSICRQGVALIQTAQEICVNGWERNSEGGIRNHGSCVSTLEAEFIALHLGSQSILSHLKVALAQWCCN